MWTASHFLDIRNGRQFRISPWRPSSLLNSSKFWDAVHFLNRFCCDFLLALYGAWRFCSGMRQGGLLLWEPTRNFISNVQRLACQQIVIKRVHCFFARQCCSVYRHRLHGSSTHVSFVRHRTVFHTYYFHTHSAIEILQHLQRWQVHTVFFSYCVLHSMPE